MKKLVIGCGTIFLLIMIFGTVWAFVPQLHPQKTPTITEIELNEAKTQGLIEYFVRGTGSIESLEINITSKTTKPLIVRVLPGSVFTSFESFVQNMIVIAESRISLDPKEVIEDYEINVACINMNLSVPFYGHRLTLSSATISEDLIKLVQLPAFQARGFRFQQFAIWTITDNPNNVDEYKGIASGGYPFGTGPTKDDIASIRELFESAGIDTSKYYVLHW